MIFFGKALDLKLRAKYYRVLVGRNSVAGYRETERNDVL